MHHTVFGITLGFITLIIIGLGFFWVIRGEYYLGVLWWPYFMAAGLVLIGASLYVASAWGSAALGVFGASLVWGATELRDQAARARVGWYPRNPGGKVRPPLAGLIEKWPLPHL